MRCDEQMMETYSVRAKKILSKRIPFGGGPLHWPVMKLCGAIPTQNDIFQPNISHSYFRMGSQELLRNCEFTKSGKGWTLNTLTHTHNIIFWGFPPPPKIELPSAWRDAFFSKIWFLGKRSRLFWGPKVFKTKSFHTEKWSNKKTFRMILVESLLILIDWEIPFATSFWRGNP